MFTPKLHDAIAIQNELGQINHIFLVTDYFDRDLFDIFDKVDPEDFSELHVITIIYNLLCSVKFLKTSNVIHRDLKPENIMIDDQCHISICDFGLARTMPI